MADNNHLDFGVDLLPATTETYNLGTSTKKWNNIYGKKVYSGGNEVLTSHLTYTAVSGKKPTGNQTPGFGSTFDVEQVGLAASGLVSVTERTVKIPDTIAKNDTIGLVKPWYSHTVASTGPTTGNNSTAVAVNAITTTAGKYYAIEADSNGRLFVNVPWTNVNSSYLTSHANGYGLITVSTLSSAVTALTALTSAVTVLSKSANEILKFTTANKWIVITGTNSDTAGADEIKFAHALSGVTAKTSYGSTATAANVNGGSLTVTDIKFDAAGHITASTDRTITLQGIEIIRL